MKRLACIAVLVASVVWQGYGQQGADPEIELKIMALERLRIQAITAKDPRTLDALLDDEFVAVDQDGQAKGKGATLVYVQVVDSLRCVTRQMAVRIHGGTVIVTGLYEIRVVLNGTSVLREGRFVNTWLNRDGRWKVIASLQTPAP